MGNDIEIRVRVANNTATGITAVNRSLNNLRDEARDAGRSLDGLAVRAAATAVALRSLKDAAQDASRALRSLNTAARNTDGRLTALSDRSRTLRSDTDDLDGSMRRLTTTMGGVRGSTGTLRTSFGNAGNGMQQLKAAAITLAPALIPVAASLVPIAAQAGAAGIAVGVFGAAMLGQLSAVKNAADAQTKYTDAVKKHGPASQQAAQAETLFLDQVRQMDPATRRTAAALGVLKDQYKAWSKSLAGDTMPVATKGLAIFGALMPKLTPVVKGAAGELNRFMTILGGGVNSSGFSKFMDSFARFSTGALSKANDGLVRFMRTMSGGAGSAQFTKFMEYAQRVGPAVGETLLNLSKGLVHLVAAASETGVSMLTLVNAFAKLVNAIPTEVLSTLLQFVVVLKAVKLAAAGMAAMGGLSAFATSLGAMRTAAAGATGPLASLGAAFGALSRTAKVALVGAGIGILVIALSRLSTIGKSAPPDIDRMTTALGKLGTTGKVTGEAARVFGTDFGKLGDSLRTLSRPSNLDKFQQGLTSLIGMDSTPVKDAKEAFDGLDKGLTSLVKGGKAELAAAALETSIKNLKKQGFTSKEVTSQLDDYKAALADQALEQQLAAQAMGLFGDQALAVQGKLDAQKQSADGLRQSIEALNDANRSALGGMIGFEASIDAASKAAKENANSLDMVNGHLDVNSPKAQAAAAALNDLASKTKDAALSARESGESWEYVNGIYERGRSQLIKSAEAMGLTETQARQLADQIMKVPDKTAKVKGNIEDLEAKIKAAKSKLSKVPDSRKAKVRGEISDLEAKLAQARRDLAAIDGQTATVRIMTQYFTAKSPSQLAAAHGRASGGLAPGYADGGQVVQTHPNGGLITGPGSGTSDSVLEMSPNGGAYRTSNREYIVQESSVRKYGVGFLDALNAGRLKLAGFAKGGLTKAEKQARHDAVGQLTISHFGRVAGYQNDEFRSALGKADSVGSLVNALNQWRGVIKAATHGATESRLLKQLEAAGKGLLKYEKQLNSVNKSLEKAKEKLDGLKQAAAQMADSVKSGVLSSANITKGAQGDAPVTVKSIMSGLTSSRDKASSFSKALADLKKKGVSKDLIGQIAEAGIEGGGLETAGALLGASKSEIASMNKLQSQINSSAKAAGKTAADAMYGAGIKAAEGLVAGLQKKQDAIEKAMMKIAKSMEKAIKKALGIKSPSRVMLDVGHQTAEGFALGIQRNKSVQPAWASMLNVPRTSAPRAARSAATTASSTAGGGWDGRPIVIPIDIGGSHLGTVLVDVTRKEVRVRGGNVQAVLGQGS